MSKDTRGTLQSQGQEHTPGPWYLADSPHSALDELGYQAISSSRWGALAEVCVAGGEGFEREGEANARRIVACVNACEGISTASLEYGDTKEWIKEEIHMRGEFVQLQEVNDLVIAERDRLREEKRELVETLSMMCEEYAKLPHSLGYSFTHLPKIDALLAKLS